MRHITLKYKRKNGVEFRRVEFFSLTWLLEQMMAQFIYLKNENQTVKQEGEE